MKGGKQKTMPLAYIVLLKKKVSLLVCYVVIVLLLSIYLHTMTLKCYNTSEIYGNYTQILLELGLCKRAHFIDHKNTFC